MGASLTLPADPWLLLLVLHEVLTISEAERRDWVCRRCTGRQRKEVLRAAACAVWFTAGMQATAWRLLLSSLRLASHLQIVCISSHDIPAHEHRWGAIIFLLPRGKD